MFLPRESQGRGAWWAAIYGVTQSRTRLKQCSHSRVLSRVQYATCFTVSPCWFYGNRIPESMVTPWDLGEFLRQWITQVTNGRGNLELSLNSFQYLTERSFVPSRMTDKLRSRYSGDRVSYSKEKNICETLPLPSLTTHLLPVHHLAKRVNYFPLTYLWSDVIYGMMKQRRNLEEAGVCSG